MVTTIQFIKGLDEKVLPDVRLTRSRDGSTGTATFRFKNPNILDKSTAKEGEITGMYLIDSEGTLVPDTDVTYADLACGYGGCNNDDIFFTFPLQ